MIKSYLRAASLGIEIAVAVFIGAFIGYKLDEIDPLTTKLMDLARVRLGR
jgi:F0F1-type ATP synthase assembly protein I